MKRILKSISALLLVAVAAYFGIDLTQQNGTAAPNAQRPGTSAEQVTTSPGVARVAQADRERESGIMVTVPADVIKVLPDDNEGSRHQRFLIKLSNQQTLLVAHNIDLAPRVPLDEGDVVEIRGQYEWNDRGGVLHWTHHDPKGWREGGWIAHRGKKYE